MTLIRHCFYGCLVTILFASGLAGCVSMHGPILSAQQTLFKQQKPQQLITKLKVLTTWQAQGAFSIQSAQQVGMGHMDLRVSPKSWQAHISSSLNIAQLTMGSAAVGIWYTDPNGKIAYAPSVQSLMMAQFGFALPFKTLLYWLKGLPAPGRSVTTYNRYGQLLGLRQFGWVMHYSQYGLYHAIALPGVITVHGHAENVKIVIKKWSFLDASSGLTAKVNKKN